MNRTLLLVLVTFGTFGHAQQIERLWSAKDYEGVYANVDRVDRMRGSDMLRVAQAAFKLNHDSEAVYILELAERKGYAGDQHYFVKGEVHFSLQEFDKAAEAYHEALHLNHNRLPYLMALGDAYYRGNRLDSALAVYQRVHQMFPEKDVATFAMCKIPAEQGFLAKSAQCWRDNVTAFVDRQYEVRAREEYSNILWHGIKDTAEAAVQINRLIRMEPDVVKFRLSAIQIHAELDEWEVVDAQRAELTRIEEEGKLTNFYLGKNAYPILDMVGGYYRLQFFETIEVRPEHAVFKAKWSCFLATPQHGVLAGTWKYVENDDEYWIYSTEEGYPPVQLEAPLTLRDFVSYMRSIESKM
ncbi:tetratricopeptide repeat protein [Phaeocystidibacter luteus]|uniref:Uncharacterized protein n=1 Tax=Phaeocystidibacter luteus TaxID=911197 RepID=A0A6N6RJ32_9FLAO|nr:tetratricopeptide repeat protein [Phaeocystidibacter luteus]KAB2813976.1 hypothetical protein F8C67_04645 [Phaeocystidibacter luteus]